LPGLSLNASTDDVFDDHAALDVGVSRLGARHGRRRQPKDIEGCRSGDRDDPPERGQVMRLPQSLFTVREANPIPVAAHRGP